MDTKFVKENLEAFRQSLKKRYINVNLEKILVLDKQYKEYKQKYDENEHEIKKISKEIEKILQSGLTAVLKDERKKKLSENSKSLKEKRREDWNKARKAYQELNQLLFTIPNLLSTDVPVGRTEEDNQEVKKWGKIPKFDFKVKDHVELGERLDIIDLEAGAKVAGSRFYYLKNEGALLEIALINFAFGLLSKYGFIPVITPELVKERITTATGFRPRSEAEDQIYKIEDHDLYLVATAEVSLLGMHADTVFAENEIPKYYCGFSTSFRTEAGSWGKDVRGILRTHQFDKVEMFVFCKPADSKKIHEELLSYEEEIYQKLEIPYRVANVCAGDLGSPAFKKYDIEAWIPSQNRYREITSCSNTTDYQARRLNIKFAKNGQKEFVHTLNGTAIAIGRTLIAILENYQQKDGTVAVPKVLQKYTNFSKVPVKRV